MPGTSYVLRQQRLAELVNAEGFHALLVNPGPSLTYLTGLHFHLSERPTVALFRPGQAPVLVLPELETRKIENLEYELTPFTYGEDVSTWERVFRRAVQETGLDYSRVAVEPRRLRLLELRLLESAAPRAAYLDGTDVVARLRMYKDADEVAMMRRAVDIAQDAAAATVEALQEGVTEREIAGELTIQMLRRGSEPELPFSPIVAFGSETANPHAVPRGRALRQGDLVLVDWGANADGYFSDLTRMFSFGEPDGRLAEITDIVGQANAAARAAVKPGTLASDIDHAAREVIRTAGFGEYFIHRTGHGLGLEIHEEPYMRAGNEQALEPGMTFTIEPGIYLPGVGGARIEDDVVVTQNGVESLSRMERSLRVLNGR